MQSDILGGTLWLVKDGEKKLLDFISSTEKKMVIPKGYHDGIAIDFKR